MGSDLVTTGLPLPANPLMLEPQAVGEAGGLAAEPDVADSEPPQPAARASSKPVTTFESSLFIVHLAAAFDNQY
jgi:hypothetical protein